MSEGSEGGYDNKNDDYYPSQNDNYDSNYNDNDSGMMQGNNPPPFGRGGRGAWRGGGGNRGHFNSRGGGGGMQNRGFQQNRGGGRGFMNRGGGGNRGGPGGPGFMHNQRGGGPRFRGHHDMPGGGGGNWNNNAPPHSGMGGMEDWAEARSPDGKIYYYHTVTRETTWEKPQGPNIRVIRHDEFGMMHKQQNPMDQGGGGGYPGPHKDHMPPQQQQQSQPPPQNFPGGPLGPPGGPPFGAPPNLQMPPPGFPGQPPNSMPMQPVGPNNPPPGTLQPPPNQAPPGSSGENGEPKGSDGIPPTAQVPPLNNPPPVAMNMPPPGMPPAGINMPPPFGFPPVGPPFGMPPGMPPMGPPGFPGNFGLPPPWLPPVPVPPPAMQAEQMVLSQVDPKILQKAYEWTEHTSPDAKTYYFNSKTQASVWEKPSALVEFEAAKLVAQQRLVAAPMNPTGSSTTPAKETKTSTSEKTESSNGSVDTSKVKETKSREKKSSAGEKCRPVSSTPVPGSPWCVVWTGDKRVFFYNPSNKQSVWEKPQDLVGRYDVEELLKSCPDAKSGGKVKKAEATSTTSPLSDADKLAKENSSGQPSSAPPPIAVATKIEHHSGISIIINKDDKEKGLSRKLSQSESSDKDEGPPTKKSKTSEDSKSGIEVITIGGETILNDQDDDDSDTKGGKSSTNGSDKEVIKIETKDGFKEMTALEAEVKASRERAIVPLETRIQKFREMLIEKQVSAFSTWEKELHKIVFDPRYLILNSRERKTTFESFVKERAEEERKEKKKHMKQVKEHFFKFLESVHVSQKMSYSEFSQKYSRDERFRNVEKARDREQYFNEHISELKRREKEERVSKKEKAKEDLTSLFKEKIKDYHMKWPEVRKKLEQPLDSRTFEVLENDEREEIFRVFQKKLKAETKLKEKKKKKEKKEKEKERKAKEKKEKLLKLKEEQGNIEENPSIVPSEDRDEISPDEDEIKGDEDEDTKNKDEDDNDKSSEGKIDDVSEEEEGCITDDTDDEIRLEREKKERAEASMREREREVQRTLQGHLRDRDKEREFYRHEEAVQEFQALLTDLVRNVDLSWKEAKKLIKKDRRWPSVSILSRDEMEDLFNQHEDNISRKKKIRFRELLEECRVKLTSTWKDVKKRIKDDPRYLKFSSSERKCEREFELYLKDMSANMKADFRNLLKETKTLTYKTKQQIREQPYMMKDIESLLSKDKRYLNLDGMPEERHRLLLEYFDDLEKRGPPPPPTSSVLDPSRRLKA